MGIESKQRELDMAPEWIRAAVANGILGYKTDSVVANLVRIGRIRGRKENRALMVCTEDVRFYFELRKRAGKIK